MNNIKTGILLTIILIAELSKKLGLKTLRPKLVIPLLHITFYVTSLSLCSLAFANSFGSMCKQSGYWAANEECSEANVSPKQPFYVNLGGSPTGGSSMEVILKYIQSLNSAAESGWSYAFESADMEYVSGMRNYGSYHRLYRVTRFSQSNPVGSFLSWVDAYRYCPTGWYFSASNNSTGGFPGYCARPLVKKKKLGKTGCSANQPYLPGPINIATGNKYLEELDYLSNNELSFKRYYNSHSAFSDSAVGMNWQHSFDRSLNVDSANWVTVVHQDGSYHQFKPSGTGTYASEEVDTKDTLIELKDANNVRTGWRYTVFNTGEVETYDIGGKLSNTSSRSGQLTTYTYSNATTPLTIAPSPNLLISVSDQRNNSIKFIYEESNSSTPTNESTQFKYRIKTLVTADGSVINYGYNSFNNLTTVTYPDGKTKTYFYAEPAQVSSTPSYGVRYTYALTGVVDENNARYMSYSYDAEGDAFDELSPDAGSNTSHYSISLNQSRDNSAFTASVTDPRGAINEYAFDTIAGSKRLTSQSQPAGSGCLASASALTYDANGNTASRTDFNGNKTTYVHDMARNLETSRTEGLTTGNAATPATRTITTSWHPTWKLPHVISEYSGSLATGTPVKRTTHLYDDKGNITSYKVEDPIRGLSRITTTSYVYSTVVPGLILEKTIDGPLPNSYDLTRYFYYPHNATCAPSFAEPIIDPITGSAPPNYGCRGQLQHVIQPSGFMVMYNRYNHHGQLEEWTNTNELYSTNGYDLRQRLIRSTQDNEQTFYSYDDAGLLKKITFPDAAELNYTYDNAHRLTEISNSLGDKVVYTLDDTGNRTGEEVYDSSGTLKKTIARQFDALNRPYTVTGE